MASWRQVWRIGLLDLLAAVTLAGACQGPGGQSLSLLVTGGVVVTMDSAVLSDARAMAESVKEAVGP